MLQVEPGRHIPTVVMAEIILFVKFKKDRRKLDEATKRLDILESNKRIT